MSLIMNFKEVRTNVMKVRINSDMFGKQTIQMKFNNGLINNDNVHDITTLLNDMISNVNEVDHIKVNGSVC